MTSIATPEHGIAPSPTDPAGDAARGWYLYGITRRGELAPVLAELDAATSLDVGAVLPGELAPLELLECSGLAAVVRPVSLADFGAEVLQERLRSAAVLEAMVRSHNHVIETIHARQAILPAKFGVVYSQPRDIVAALRAACDTLLPRLHLLEGCDEWAVHLHADRAVVADRAAARVPALARLREEHAAARPGRAYFLQRQLRDRQEAATREALVALAQGTFDRLAAAAVAGEASPLRAAADAGAEVEILRATFLVARDGTERFAAALHEAADAREGLRAECTGPWPPYSFAAQHDGSAR